MLGTAATSHTWLSNTRKFTVCLEQGKVSPNKGRRIHTKQQLGTWFQWWGMFQAQGAGWATPERGYRATLPKVIMDKLLELHTANWEAW